MGRRAGRGGGLAAPGMRAVKIHLVIRSLSDKTQLMEEGRLQGEGRGGVGVFFLIILQEKRSVKPSFLF